MRADLGPGEARRLLYEQFARLGKVVANARRIELLELLAQGERNVESLAEATGSGITGVSANLQVLRRARLVETRREGTHVHYRLAGDEVTRFVGALRDLAHSRLAEVEAIVRDYFGERDALEPVQMSELVGRARRSEVIVLDVRPALEYDSGHLPEAVSIPLDELEGRLRELPPGSEVVAYCRGPYCVLASEAVAVLNKAGRHARRLDGGLPEWRLAGNPVVRVGARDDGATT